MPQEIIDKIIQNLSPDYRLFVESDFAETAALEFGSGADLFGRQIDILENAILLYLLVIIDEKEVVLFISNNCNLSFVEADLLWGGIISTIPEGVSEAILATRNKQLASNQESIPNLTSEISEAEHELASLQRVRTMPHDMAAIKPGSDVVYQASSQADILSREEVPNIASAEPAGPRWDSETKQ